MRTEREREEREREERERKEERWRETRERKEERWREERERERGGGGGGGGEEKRQVCRCMWSVPQVRTIAAVLLRRVFLQMEHTDLSEQIDSGVLQSCRAQLLVAVQSEPSPPIRRKICDAIAELARSSIGEFVITALLSW